MKLKPIKKKQTLYTQGKKPRFLFYLVNGKIKSYKTNEDGKEYICDLYNSGDFIGYNALIQEINYEDSAMALEDAEVMQISREDFLKMIHTDMNIASAFIRIMSNNMKEKEERMLNLAYSSLRKRIAKALIEIQNKFDEENTGEPISMSREDIAQYVGAATESLIRTLSDFKTEKLIEIKGTNIFIKNLDELRNLLF